MIEILHDLRTLNYGNYGIFLIMGNAGFISSTVVLRVDIQGWPPLFIRRSPKPQTVDSAATYRVLSTRELYRESKGRVDLYLTLLPLERSNSSFCWQAPRPAANTINQVLKGNIEKTNLTSEIPKG